MHTYRHKERERKKNNAPILREKDDIDRLDRKVYNEKARKEKRVAKKEYRTA